MCGRQKAGRTVIAAAVGIIYFCGGPNKAISRPKSIDTACLSLSVLSLSVSVCACVCDILI